MIMTGNQRGGARQMALHLLNTNENDHVTVHEIRGFVSDDVPGALNEAYAISKGTKCRQFMYSLSLNPPVDQDVSPQVFEDVLSRVEKKLDLEGQPRVIVFHEKNARRHAHCVWSRIDADTMTARNISHPKRKLKTLGKEVFLEQGWELPKGYIDPKLKDPLNYTRAEWEKAQRTKQHPKTIKSALQESWAVSDSRKAFEHALENRGYYLARGDRRGYVCIDLYGEVYSLSRQIGKRKPELEKRLGPTENLRSVEKTKDLISTRLTRQFRTYHDEIEAQLDSDLGALNSQKYSLRRSQRKRRTEQRAQQEARWRKEEINRSARLRKGFKGLWDRLIGTYQRTRRRNEAETEKCRLRDQKETQELVSAQLAERRKLQVRFDQAREEHQRLRTKLVEGMSRHARNFERSSELRQIFEEIRQERKRKKTITPDPEPDF